MKQRVIGILTTLIMVITMVVFAPMSIFAASGGDSIPYIDIEITDEATGAIKTVQSQLTGTYSTISQTDTVWGEDDADTWLILDEDITLDNRPEVKGNVHLILLNGKTLTGDQGITVETGNSLMIYAQSDKESEMGSLNINISGTPQTAIGGRNGQRGSGRDGKDCGTVCFYGGNISLQTSEVCVGGGTGLGGADGGGDGGDGGIVCFYGGNVAIKSLYCSCIGGGNGGTGGTGGTDGQGGNGGAGGSVSFYGGIMTLTANNNCIGGGNGGSGNSVNEVGGNGGNGGSNLYVSIYGGSICFNASVSCISGGYGGTSGVARGETGTSGIGGDLNADAFRMYGGDISVVGKVPVLSAGNGGRAGRVFDADDSFGTAGDGGSIKSGAIGFYGGTLTVESTDACIRAGNGGNANSGTGPSLMGTGGKGGSIESGAIIFDGGIVTLNSTTGACIRAGIGGMGQSRAANGKLADGYMTVSDSAVMKAGDSADSAETVSEYNGQKYLSVSYNPGGNNDDPVNPFNPGDHTHSSSPQRVVTPSGKTVTYYKCDCGKYFEDVACTKEITDLNAWLAKVDSEDKSGTIIQTGDTSNMTPWIGLMLISLMGLAVCIVLIKRKGE